MIAQLSSCLRCCSPAVPCDREFFRRLGWFSSISVVSRLSFLSTRRTLFRWVQKSSSLTEEFLGERFEKPVFRAALEFSKMSRRGSMDSRSREVKVVLLGDTGEPHSSTSTEYVPRVFQRPAREELERAPQVPGTYLRPGRVLRRPYASSLLLLCVCFPDLSPSALGAATAGSATAVCICARHDVTIAPGRKTARLRRSSRPTWVVAGNSRITAGESTLVTRTSYLVDLL